MSFIDWSDADGMFGLLVEFVADAKAESQNDSDRQRFLSDLLEQLEFQERGVAALPLGGMLQRLRDIHAAADRQFVDDPALVHLRDCIDELERVDRDGAR